MIRALAPLLFLVTPCLAQEQLALPSLFADHMVFQRETEAPIWGHARPLAQVFLEASWSQDILTCTANANGVWRTALTTPVAGGPHTVTVKADDEAITLNDVLVGEVWICSGQSNMEWNLSWFPEAEELLKAIDQPNLRLCKVERSFSETAQKQGAMSWNLCSTASASSFSAVGMHFGMELTKAMPDVPIGLIMTAWGGTVVEAWTSEASLRLGGEFDQDLEMLAARRAGTGGDNGRASMAARWWEHLFQQDSGLASGWNQGEIDDTDWKNVSVPTDFKTLGLGSFDGCVWFRRGFKIPVGWQGKDLVLSLGAVDDMDVAWINGTEVGSVREMGKWQSPRTYPVPGAVLSPGNNTLAVMAVDTGGAGTIGWGKGGPGSIELTCPDLNEGITLDGTWTMRTGAKSSQLGSFPQDDWFTQNTPSALSNGMIEPLVPFAMRGVIWYQGESNVDRPTQYQRLFPGMIQDWRRRWAQGDFPFYWVQLAPFGYSGDTGQAARLREAQLMSLSVPNTGQAVIMDLGNPHNIHPGHKDQVGHRLALHALEKDYGKDVISESPAVANIEYSKGRMIIEFHHGDGLHLRGEGNHHFTIAGAEHVFHPAEVQIEGSKITVSSSGVTEPLAVRFAWGAADAGMLFNGAGLCASSFRTDEWDD